MVGRFVHRSDLPGPQTRSSQWRASQARARERWFASRLTPSQILVAATIQEREHRKHREKRRRSAAAVPPRSSRAYRGKRAAAINAIGHRPKRALFVGLRVVPPTMLVTEAVDVRLATRAARLRGLIASAAARAMRVGVTRNAREAVTMRRSRPTRLEAPAGRIAVMCGRVAVAAPTLRVVRATYALRVARRLAVAVGRVAAATVATQAAAFVAYA